MEKKRKMQIAIVDDHVLIRSALASLINGFEDCEIIFEADDGRDLIDTIEAGLIPDLIILDINMPGVDGFQSAEWLNVNRPDLPILMLTMYDAELSLIRLLQFGVRGFIKKDVQPEELLFALQSVYRTGYYYSHHVSGKLAGLFRIRPDNQLKLHNNLLTEQELRFLELACSDFTYKEIATKMYLNPRSVDSLRDHLFVKLDVRSRVGLAMISIRNGLVKI